MDIDLNQTKTRIATLFVRALRQGGRKADVKPYWGHAQESYPYGVIRGERFSIGYDSEDLDTITIPFILRLVIGHKTADYKGMQDDALDTLIPLVIGYFEERVELLDDTFDDDDEIVNLEEARIVDCTYYREFQHSGIGGFQVGCEFTLNCKFRYEIQQVYE